MKVVFDTNILVSAFEFPNGLARQVLHHIRAERDLMFISPPMINELVRVLTEKFGRNDNELEEVREFFRNFAYFSASVRTLSVLADEPDNRILECAIASDADLIVTGDRAMLALERVENTRIITLADYLNTVDNSLINS